MKSQRVWRNHSNLVILLKLQSVISVSIAISSNSLSIQTHCQSKLINFTTWHYQWKYILPANKLQKSMPFPRIKSQDQTLKFSIRILHQWTQSSLPGFAFSTDLSWRTRLQQHHPPALQLISVNITLHSIRVTFFKNQNTNAKNRSPKIKIMKLPTNEKVQFQYN